MTDEVRGTSGKTYIEKLFDWCAGVPLKKYTTETCTPATTNATKKKKRKKEKKTNQRIFTSNISAKTWLP